MTDFVALFPGQGSQSIGMMQNLTSNPLIKKTFDEASDILNTNLWDMVNIENTDINQTINTQPLMLAAGIATWRVLEVSNIKHPSFAAGHSLGEFTALVAAKVFSFENGLHIVKKRAQLMQNAVPDDEGAMAAILGLKDTIDMKGNQVFKMAVNTLDMIVDETLNANNLAKEDIDWVVPHQANIRILEATAKKLNMSMDKLIVTIDEQGNTSAASIPLALDSGIKQKKNKTRTFNFNGSIWGWFYLGLCTNKDLI